MRHSAPSGPARHEPAKPEEAKPEEAGPAPALGRHIWRLLPFIRGYQTRIAFGLFMNACARACDLLPMVFAGRVVDLVNTQIAGGAAVDPRELVLYGLGVLATFLGLALFQSSSDYALDVMAQGVRHDIRMRLYSHLQRQDVAFFEDRQTGDIMSVLSSDVDNLERLFADVSTSVVRLVITFVGTYSILLWLDFHLALLLLAPLPLALGAVRFYSTRVSPQYRRARAAVGGIASVLENNIQGMAVIQAYTAEASQESRVREQSEEYRDAAVKAAWERARFVPLLYAVAGIGFASLIGVGGYMTLAGYGPTLGDYTTFILLAMRLILPLFVFGMLTGQIQQSEASARRIMELLDRKPAVVDREGAVELKGPVERIEFKGVRFAYPGRGTVINGVDFTLERGRFLGVVGPTGAGKSTLIKLLLRYYDPVGGHILVDGRELGDLRLASFRSQVGYVSQDAYLFHGTVAENIRLGTPMASLEEVARAARVAGAEEFILGLPKGFDTLVGERGVKLSGGQQQRVSLARAILRDPPLLILDEATSAVDTRTEEIIQRNLREFRQERMTLAVAHRLSTVRQSDEILVLVDGIVVERGVHDELVHQGDGQGGVYAGLWAVQSGVEWNSERGNGAGAA